MSLRQARVGGCEATVPAKPVNLPQTHQNLDSEIIMLKGKPQIVGSALVSS